MNNYRAEDFYAFYEKFKCTYLKIRRINFNTAL